MSYINNFKYNESLHLINYINSFLMLPAVIISLITAVIVMPYTRYSTFSGLCNVI
jgi:hypothetical protein